MSGCITMTSISRCKAMKLKHPLAPSTANWLQVPASAALLAEPTARRQRCRSIAEHKSRAGNFDFSREGLSAILGPRESTWRSRTHSSSAGSTTAFHLAGAWKSAEILPSSSPAAARGDLQARRFIAPRLLDVDALPARP